MQGPIACQCLGQIRKKGFDFDVPCSWLLCRLVLNLRQKDKRNANQRASKGMSYFCSSCGRGQEVEANNRLQSFIADWLKELGLFMEYLNDQGELCQCSSGVSHFAAISLVWSHEQMTYLLYDLEQVTYLLAFLLLHSMDREFCIYLTQELS